MRLHLVPIILALLISPSVLSAQKTSEPRIVSFGESIELGDFLVPGKTVIFDFMSPYCPPCKMYEEPLRSLHSERSDIVVVKVNINRPGVKGIDWESPVALQYAMGSIPRFKIFGPDGKLIAEDIGNNKPAREMVNKWCEALGY